MKYSRYTRRVEGVNTFVDRDFGITEQRLLRVYWVFGILGGFGKGLLRACSSALSHSIDAGDVEPDELDEKDVVDKPGTRTGR